MELEVNFPDKLGFLFEPMRYKVARGGRGSGKSWGFARALLLLGVQKKLRIMCSREIQKSIGQSVHKLLSDQIDLMGLRHFYQVLATEIRGANGTEFMFAGLSDITAGNIKSTEGIDIVWVEEAQTVTEKSWSTLIPTIRKPGSEIWVSYNPELETDPTHVRFVVKPPQDCTTVLMNWRDNPWFTVESENERQDCLRRFPDDYDNVWEGKCKPAVSGAIYYKEIEASQAENRICNVPYDPQLKVHAVFDLGWNDSMSIGLVQKQASELRVIEYIEDSHKTLEYYSSELKKRNYNYGTLYLPHDGAHKDFKTGKSSQEIMQGYGWTVEITPNSSVEEGIRLARMVFPRVYFDKSKTERLIECLKRYRRHIPQGTGEASRPVHDEFSHGADFFRYLAINSESMTNESWGGKLNYPRMNYA